MIANKEIQSKLTKNFLDLIVLQMLETHPMHGYEIITTIRKDFGVYFGASTIYPLLNTMENKQYVKCAWNMGGQRPKKVYELTADGKSMLDYTAGSLRAICNTFTKSNVSTNNVGRQELQFDIALGFKRGK